MSLMQQGAGQYCVLTRHLLLDLMALCSDALGGRVLVTHVTTEVVSWMQCDLAPLPIDISNIPIHKCSRPAALAGAVS